MKLEQGTFCPLIKDKCKQLECAWFTQIRGHHPQTGAPVDEWDCAVKWLPTLLIENTVTTRGTQAATESMRNEIVKRMDGHSPPPPSEMLEQAARWNGAAIEDQR